MNLWRGGPCFSRIGAGHEICSDDSRTVDIELGDENVGIFHIALRGLAFLDRREGPAASNASVEYSRKYTGRVESWHTTPINRSIIAHKCHGPRVTNRPVGSDLLVFGLDWNRESCQASSAFSSRVRSVRIFGSQSVHIS